VESVVGSATKAAHANTSVKQSATQISVKIKDRTAPDFGKMTERTVEHSGSNLLDSGGSGGSGIQVSSGFKKYEKKPGHDGQIKRFLAASAVADAKRDLEAKLSAGGDSIQPGEIIVSDKSKDKDRERKSVMIGRDNELVGPGRRGDGDGDRRDDRRGDDRRAFKEAESDGRRGRSRSRPRAVTASSISSIAAEGPVTREILQMQEKYSRDDRPKPKRAQEEVVTGAQLDRRKREAPARVSSNWDNKVPVASTSTQMPSKPAMVGGGGNHKVLRLSAMQIRAFLGRGGNTIATIRKTTGADIKIHHPPSEEYGTVSIVGNVEMVESLIHQAIVEKGCAMTPMGRGPGVVGNVGDEEEVLIPQNVGLKIIGENGEGLAGIKNMVRGQVHIKADAPMISGGPIKLTIGGIGRREAVVLIKTKMAEMMAAVAQSRPVNFMQ